MNRKEEFYQLKKEYKNMEIPERGREQLQTVIATARKEKKRATFRKNVFKWATVAAAVLIIAILPNTNEAIANTMQEIPVIGKLFQVITIKEYRQDDGKKSMSVEIPQIQESNSENSGAVLEINKNISDYTEELKTKFWNDIKKGGYGKLKVSYKKITDNDKWFTLKISATEIEASGYEFQRYYHINKMTGKVAQLKDLFKDNVDYVTLISNEIIRQMKEQMQKGDKTYFLEENEINDRFQQIKKNQNFYFNENGNIVIAFDEYEVGPGCIGTPEFVIPNDVVKSIMK